VQKEEADPKFARTIQGALALTLILGTTSLAHADDSPPVAAAAPAGR
jgi:hypothetical protein